MRSRDATTTFRHGWPAVGAALLLLAATILSLSATTADAALRRGSCDTVRFASPSQLKTLQRQHRSLRRVGSFSEVTTERVAVRHGHRTRFASRQVAHTVCVRPVSAKRATTTVMGPLGGGAAGSTVGAVDFPPTLTGTVTLQLPTQLGTVGWQLLDMPAAPRRTFAAGTAYSTADADVVSKVGVGTLKESIVVYARQGVRTWRWRLVHGGGMAPQLQADGSVRIGNQVRLRAPVLTAPDGTVLRTAAWQLDGDVLSLRVDDRALAVPYVVDPSADYPQRLYLRSTAATTLTAPAGAQQLLPAQGVAGGTSDLTKVLADTSGYMRFRPGRANAGGVIGVPSNLAGPATGGSDGWYVDPAGGMTVPAGSFTVGAQVYRVGGAVNPTTTLWARLWKVTTNAGSMTASSPITDWGSGVGVQVTTGAGVSLTTTLTAPSAVAIGPTDHLYLEMVANFSPAGAAGPTNVVLKQENANTFVDFGTAPYNQLVTPTNVQVLAPTPIGASGWSTSRFPVFRANLVDPEWYNHNSFEFCSVATALATSACSGTTTGVATSPSGQLVGGASDSIDATTWSPATGLPDGTHYLRVRSVEDSGMSGQSSFTTNAGTSCITVPSNCDVLRVDATAPSVTITQPATTNVLNVPVSFAVSDATSGLATYKLQRRDATLSGGSCAAFGAAPWNDVVTTPTSVYGDTTVANATCVEYRMVATDVAGNTTTLATGTTTMVDTTAPSPTGTTLAELTGTAWTYATGTTMWFNPGKSGSFRVTVAFSDGESGPSQVSFPALGAGWTPAATSTDGSSPYSVDYAFTSPPAPNDPGAVNATVRDVATNSASAPFSVKADGTAPSGGSVTHTNGIWNSPNLSVSFVMPTDAGSGVASWVLQRSDTAANAGACDPLAWTAYATVGVANQTSPFADSGLANGRCYRYQLVVTDNVGNVDTLPSGFQTIVDTAGPTATFTSWTESSAFAYWDGASSRLWFNPAAGVAQSADLVVTATDASGVASVGFPDLLTAGWGPAGGGSQTVAGPGNTYRQTYTFAPGALDPGTYSATATDVGGNATLVGFDVERDAAAPVAATVSHLNGTVAGASITVTFSKGNDGVGSGIASWKLQRASTGTIAGACDNASWTGYSDIGGGNPAGASYTDLLVSDGSCYRYQIVVTDQVGNVATVLSGSTTTVDASPPTATFNSWVAGTNPQWQHGIGTVMYVNTAHSGDFQLLIDASDSSSSISGVDFPLLGAGWNPAGTSVVGSPYAHTYAWAVSAASPGAHVATAHDAAGNPGTAGFSVVADTTPPTGASITHFNGYTNSTTGTVTFAVGSDSQSGVKTWHIERTQTTLSNGTCAAAGWTAFAQVGAADPVAPTFTDPTALASGMCYQYELVVDDYVGNVRTQVAGQVIMVDTGAPAASFGGYVAGLNPGFQFASGSTMYVNPVQSGSFTLKINVTDTVAGVDGVLFPDVNGAGSGWTPVGGSYDNVGTSPYTVSYFWTGPGINDPGNQTATAYDKATNSAPVGFRIEADGTAPSGGSVSHLNGFQATTSTPVTFTAGTDSQSGLASFKLERRDAPLTSGACGVWQPWGAVSGPNPTSPFNDSPLANAKCYQYRIAMTDNVGNVGWTQSSDTTMIDLGPPVVAFDSFQVASPWAYWSGLPSTTLWYNAAATAPFTADVLVSATDASGIWRVDFPGLGAAGWGPAGGGSDTVAEPTDLYRQTYSFTPGAGAPVSPSVATGYDNAGNPATANFDIKADTSNPTGGSVTYPNGWQSALAVDVSFVAGTDAESGVAKWQLQRRDTNAIVGGCNLGGWSAFADVGPVSPVGPYHDAPLTDARCYQYQLVVTDRVGRTATFTSTNEVRVDATPPTGSIVLTEGTNPQYQFLSAPDTIYFNPAKSGTFAAQATASASLSGLADVTFPGLGTGWAGGGIDTTSTFDATYSWMGPSVTNPTNVSASAHSVAGAVGPIPFHVYADNAGPTGGSVSYVDQFQNTTSTIVTTTNGVDPIGVSRRVLERSQATLSGGACGGYGGWTQVGVVDQPSPFTDSPLSGTPPTCYKYRWTEYDNVDNATYNTIAASVRVDQVNPSVPVLSRTGNTMTWPAQTDAHSGMASIDFLVNGAVMATLAPTATSYNFGALADGVYTFVVRTYDKAGNQSDSAPLVLTVDNTPPAAFTLNPPVNPALPAITTGGTNPACTATPTYGSATPTFSWNASSDAGSGINRYEIWVDGVLRGTAGPLATSWVMSPALAPGGHTWKVVVYDNFGLATTSTPAAMNVRFDTASPSFASAMSPAGGVWTTNIKPTLVWSANDENCLARVRVLVDGAVVAVAGGSENAYTLTAPQALADGLHTWQIEAIDVSGNSKFSTVANFGVDTTGPTGITPVTPAAGSTISAGDTMFDWTPATDAGTGVATYTVYVDGVLRTACGWGPCPATTMPFGTDAWGTYPVPAGAHTWMVRATDVAGNYTDFTWSFTAVSAADTTPPSLFHLMSPANGALLASNGNTLQWQPSYDFNGVDHYDVYFDGIKWATMPGTSTTLSPDVSGGGTPLWTENFDPQLLPWSLSATPCGATPSCSAMPWSIGVQPFALTGNGLGFTNEDGKARDMYADMGNIAVPPAGGALVGKIHYDTHAAYDGGQWEVSTDGGVTWQSTCNVGSILKNSPDCKYDIVEPVGGYTDELTGHTASPLKYKETYTGSNTGMTDTRIYLSKFAGTTIKLRMHFAFDTWTTANTPPSKKASMYLDDISLISGVLAPGTHTWYVQAFDPAGNMTQTPETWTFVI